MTTSSALALKDDVIELATRGGWTAADVQLIQEMRAKNTTPEEFKLFLTIAAKYKLDPLTGQIWCQKYRNGKDGGYYPAQIFVGYNGLLEIANRGDLLDGMQSSTIKDDKGQITGATCSVWKKGCAHPFVVEVAFSEYAAPDRNPLWKSKPETMIKKVAAAHALRMAFNLSGLYIQEEFDAPLAAQQAPGVTIPPQLEVVDSRSGEIIPMPLRAGNKLPPGAARAVDRYNEGNGPGASSSGGTPTSTGMSEDDARNGPLRKERFAVILRAIFGTGKDREKLAAAAKEVALALGHENLNDLIADIEQNAPADADKADPWRTALHDFVQMQAEKAPHGFDWRWDDETGLPVEIDVTEVAF